MDKEKLEKLVELLEKRAEIDAAKIPGRPQYDQSRFWVWSMDDESDCGTPGCALGEWTAAHPDVWEMGISGPVRTEWAKEPYFGWCPFNHAAREFDITLTQAMSLFHSYGCGGARNAQQAADYLRKWIEEPT